MIKSFLVDCITIHKIFFQYRVRPLTELNTTLRMDTVTDGNDDIEIV